jgi:sterol 24-C-methyltransferase
MALVQNTGKGMVDGRDRERIANYTKFWDKDISKEDSTHTENRVDSYTDVVNGVYFFPFCLRVLLSVANDYPSFLSRSGYYDGATELYEYGWADSFHFCRFYPGEAFAAALARHEHYLAAQMRLRPGMRVLDVGCGVGGPARAIARFADVEIVGLNNNEFQVQRARRYTKRAGLEGKVTFVQGDFMKLEEQFGRNYFDAGGTRAYYLAPRLDVLT